MKEILPGHAIAKWIFIITLSALQALAEGKLVTLAKENGPCSNPKKLLSELNSMSEEVFYEKLKTAQLNLNKKSLECR